MNRAKIFGAAAILSLMFATPVFAQAAIQEPGAFAFYYPNYDVLNGGRPTPAARMDAMAGFGPLRGRYAHAAPHNTADRAFFGPPGPLPQPRLGAPPWYKTRPA